MLIVVIIILGLEKGKEVSFAVDGPEGGSEEGEEYED